MRLGPVVFCVLLATLPPKLSAQRQASLGAGTGLVRYAGGTSFSALTLAPAAQIFSASAFLGASGGLSLLEGGVWASQGRADFWSAIAGSATSTRLALSATAGFTTRSDGVAAGSGSAIVEIVRPNFALGAGGVTGVIQQETGVGAFRVRGRAWWQLGPTEASLTSEATRFLGAWYTDVVGGVSFDGARTVASLWVSGRFSSTYGSTGAASASVQYFLTPRVAVEGSGGNYLRDPFQGLPRAGFLTAGVRVFAARRASMAAAAPAAPQLRPLVAQHRSGAGDTVFVRFRMPGAHGVGIAGNWNSWTPAPLRAAGNDIWEAALLLPAGTYYFNLVVDGTDWVVPGGVATISDGMGGMIAVLNVL